MVLKTGAHNRDCEDALDMVMSIAIVKNCIFRKSCKWNIKSLVLRSKGKIDVSKIAGKFGGGGHLMLLVVR